MIFFVVLLLGSVIFYITPAGRQKIDQLLGLTGTLEIVTTESLGAVNISLDGKTLTTTNAYREPVKVGSYTLRLEKEGFDSKEISVQIKARQETIVIAAAEGEAPPALSGAVLVFLSPDMPPADTDPHTDEDVPKQKETCKTIEIYLTSPDEYACKKYTNSCELPDGYTVCSPDASSELPDAEQESLPVLKEETMTDSGDDPAYSLEITYPKLTQGNAKQITACNAFIRSLIDEVTADFLDSIQPVDDAVDLEAYGLGTENTLIGSYTEYFLDNSYISIKLEFSVYYAGGAHPGTIIRVVNYDLDRSQEVTLSSLFKPASNYLTLLSAQSKELLIEILGESTWEDGSPWADGVAPQADNFKDFTVAADGLHITFDEYQVASYAMGRPEITIPHNQLTSITAADSMLAHSVP